MKTLIALAVAGIFLLTACGDDGTGKKAAAHPTRSAAPAATPSPPSSPTPTPTPEPTARPLAGKTIVVDPGHNRRNRSHTQEIARKVDAGNGSQKPCNTTGTETNDGYTEAEFTWDTAQRLAGLLRTAGANVVVTLTDSTPWGPCVDERAHTGNSAHAAAVISIHADGAPASGHGFHVMEPGLSSPNRDPSRRLAAAVRDAYRSGTGMPASNYIGHDGLNPRTDMAGLNLSTVPAAMLESGNMRNAEDAARLKDPAFRQRIAQALVTALDTFLNG